MCNRVLLDGEDDAVPATTVRSSARGEALRESSRAREQIHDRHSARHGSRSHGEMAGERPALPTHRHNQFGIALPHPVELGHAQGFSYSLLSPALRVGRCRDNDGRHCGPRNPFAHDGGDRKQGHKA